MNVQPLPDPELKSSTSEAPSPDAATGEGFETILHGQSAALEQAPPARTGAGSMQPPGSVDWERLARAGEQLAELGRRLGRIGAVAPAAAPAEALPGSAAASASLPAQGDLPLAAAATPLPADAEATLPPLPPLPEAALPGAASDAGIAGRLRAPLPEGGAQPGSPESGSDEGERAGHRSLGEALREERTGPGTAASRAFEAALETQVETRAVSSDALPIPSPLAGTELAAGSSPSFGPTAPAAALPVGSPEEAVPVHVEWLAAKGGGRARFQLHPPNLGSVELSVSVRGSSVDIVVHTQDAAAQAAVAGSRDLLADGLATRDLRIESFDVRSNASEPSLSGSGLSDDRSSSEARSQLFDASRDGQGSGKPGSGRAGLDASLTPPAAELLAGPPVNLLSDAPEGVDLHI